MAFRLQAASLDWALAHALRFGDTDIFPRPFELAAIRYNWQEVRAFLSQCDLTTWQSRPHRRTMSPKGRFAFRSATQLDPFDGLVFSALVYEIGPQLEAYRVPPEKRIVYSHRFAPEANGRLYSIKNNWGTFLARCRTISTRKAVKYVVVADIADFYPRLYHHRVENTLMAATGGSPHVGILKRLISDWAEGGASYGLPVGPAACRIIADVTIDDVDQTLSSEGITFCRYSDDYRIFCATLREAHERLELLATVLHRDHGLTLQQGKTLILSKDDFSKRFLTTPAVDELNNLYSKFRELLTALGINDPYAEIDYGDLNDGQRGLIDELNLEDLLRQQMANDDVDISTTKFVLRRLAQLDDKDIVGELLDNIDQFYPVIAQVVQYLKALTTLTPTQAKRSGKKIIKLLEEGTVGHLPYHQAWLLSLFSENSAWDNYEQFAQLYGRLRDPISRRKLILSLGRSHQDFWFRTRKNDVLAMDPWERRAFLAGASCLPGDEPIHWYRSLRSRLDLLERTVVKWVNDNPF